MFNKFYPIRKNGYLLVLVDWRKISYKYLVLVIFSIPLFNQLRCDSDYSFVPSLLFLKFNLHQNMYSEHSYTILITGGAGYIGFHIGLQLLQLKHKVILLDINYPNKKWDSNLEFSPNGNGEEMEDMSCSYGTMKFVKGNFRYSNCVLFQPPKDKSYFL